jgi:serine/threonine protein kinase
MGGPDVRGKVPSTLRDESGQANDSRALEVTRTTDPPSLPTAQAPSFRPHVVMAAGNPVFPSVGEQLGDFTLLKLLGAGSFGQVFLARQISLNREVALKITANRGGEARTLARLEHDHIVQVFSETVAPDRNLQLLCMQFVPGTTLARIIARVQERPRQEWSGQAILEAVDNLIELPAAFHPAALRDRAMLEDADYYQAVCWLIARLAEALDYAHSRNVLHRDIKPANILVNHYGRPFLADFNLSLRGADAEAGPAMFGGTLAYMSPEHLDAFLGLPDCRPEMVCERSDIYSLGMVLFEMLAGVRASSAIPAELDQGSAARFLSAKRRESASSARDHNPDVPVYLDGVVARCLSPLPEQRYVHARVLASSLDGCRELRRIHRELPKAGPITQLALRHPFGMIVAFAILPHVLGSLVNFSYNEQQIATDLSPEQKRIFLRVVLAYNLIVYPFCLWACFSLIAPVWRAWRNIRDGRLAPQDPSTTRKQALALPLWMVLLACLGWLPGGILFPALISWFDAPLEPGLYGRFFISFTLSGLIAITYSFFGLEFVVLRVLYPGLWPDVRDVHQIVGQEIHPQDRRLKLFQLLAGVIPLAGAFLLVAVGAEVSGGRSFRLLLTSLIVLGMVGFGVAMWVNQALSQTLSVLTRRHGRPVEWSRYLGPTSR